MDVAPITPLPYETEVQVVPGQFCYCLRLTPCDEYCINSIMEDFINKNEDVLDKWAYGHEMGNDEVEHYHFVIYTKIEINKLKDLVRNFIYPFFPDRRRGFGNKQYNLQYSKDPRNALSYCFKEKLDYDFSGFTEECIKYLIDQSFTKPSFDKDVIELNNKYMDTKMSDEDYLVGYYKIYATYNRSINVATITGYLLSIKVRKNPEYAIILAKKNLMNI